MITFVIPSIGRETLKRSLQSLIHQSNQEWKAIVGLDGVKIEQLNDLPQDNRVQFLELEKSGRSGKIHGVGGTVRNQIISQIEDGIIAFLDDDDSLSRYYVEEIYKNFIDNPIDCVVLRMIYSNGNFLPPYNCDRLSVGKVGISFAVKTKFLKENNLFFRSSEVEDFDLLKRISSLGKIHLSDYIGYKINH